MSTGEHDSAEEAMGTDAATAVAEPKVKLDLKVEITETGPCKKHLKVLIARSDVDRQFTESIGQVRKEAAVPGFRTGRAPKTLVEKRFRKEVAGQVKSTLLMACLEQLDDEYKLNPISQPELDVEAITIPDDGPMQFEMDVEVQPDFPLPAYKALSIKRPIKAIEESDIEAQLKRFLEGYAQIVPKFEGGAEAGDLVMADLKFHKDGVDLNTAKEIQFRLQPELRFQDGRVPDLMKALEGAKPGDVREAEAEIGSSSLDPALRGQAIGVTFTVHDLKTLRLPTVDANFLESVGFESIEDLRTALRQMLQRRLDFQQRQSIRREIVEKLLDETPFDLPADLVARQERSTLRRQVAEMREAGLSDAEIRAREAEVRANAHEQTLRSLKEYFILSRIADEEKLKVEEEDLEAEIEAIAARTDESIRRVRARIEKEGLAEGLNSQILERKTIDRILEFAKREDVPMVEEQAAETLDESAISAPPESESEADPAPEAETA